MNSLHLRSIIKMCIVGCALLSFVSGLTPAAFAAPVTGGSWNIVSSPNPSLHYNNLQSVAAISAHDAWAVGDETGSTTGSTDLTLTEHWDGTNWNVVTSPNVTSSLNYLTAVTAVSTCDVWAVGSYETSAGSILTLIEHWNGTSWNIIPSPNPSANYNDLRNVMAISARDVWAVGQYVDSGNHSIGLIEHWNGKVWSVLSGPGAGPGSTHLYSVAAISANDVWIVGDYWPGLPLQEQTLVERWNGRSWQVVASPNFANSTISYLTGVTRVPGTKILWAVGGGYSSANVFEPLLEYWNGTTWSIVPSPTDSLTNHNLYSLVAISAHNIWAVGDSTPTRGHGHTTLTLAEQWNGTTWSIVPSPNNGTYSSSFYSMARVPNTSKLWAVGISLLPGGSQTLIASYREPDW